MRLDVRPFGVALSLGLSLPLACADEPTGGGFGTFPTISSQTDNPGDGDPGDGDPGDGDGDPTGDGDGDPNTDCGDAVVQAGEECDLGAENNDSGVCTTNCTIAVCGDGFIYDGFEDCDDGNSINTDDCVEGCNIAVCGDGFTHEGVEQCDDANDDETDGCTTSCDPAVCGDGIIQMGEQCDDQNAETGDECPACQFAFCGDSYTQTGIEECDDGNLLDNDQCVSAFCSIAFCGDGYLMEGVEECDDSNLDDDDACPSCAVATCGDGFVQAGVEECDDADVDNDNDCANDCTWNQCQPSGARAAFNTLNINTASGCWDGNPCQYDAYQWTQTHGQNFQAFDQALSCTGAPTCVANVGVTTYSSDTVCQGAWDVYCDDYLLGTLDTNDVGCTGSAMGNNCSISFPGRVCAEIELRAVEDNNNVAGCCGGAQPDSMVTGVSAW